MTKHTLLYLQPNCASYRYKFVKNIKQSYLSVLMPYFYSVLVYVSGIVILSLIIYYCR